jgi:hypothetical protein
VFRSRAFVPTWITPVVAKILRKASVIDPSLSIRFD